jgi:hypothetical protein
MSKLFLATFVFLFVIGLAFLPRATIVGEDGYVDYIVYGPGPGFWKHGYLGQPWWRRRWCPYRDCPYRRQRINDVVYERNHL